MERLRALRKKAKLTQSDLAKYLGISVSAYGNYELGQREPDNATLSRLADYFHVTVDYLLGREEEPSNIFDAGTLYVYDEIGTVAAGYDGRAEEIPTGRKVEIPKSMIHGKKDDYFVLRVKGDSMHPMLLDGDTILCQRTDSVDSGDVAVILYDSDEATVKRVRYDKGWLELVPCNPEYTVKRIEGPDLELCRVLGKVIKLIRDV